MVNGVSVHTIVYNYFHCIVTICIGLDLDLSLWIYPDVLPVIHVFSIIACVSGWIALNTRYLLSDGNVSDTHRIGTVVFMVGMSLYFLCMVYCLKSFLINVSRDVTKTLISYLIVFLLVLTFVLGIIFIAGIFNGNSDAWVYEHSGFMTIVLAHIAFFCLESPNPWLPFSIEDPGFELIKQADIPSGLFREKISSSDLTPGGSLSGKDV